MFTIFDVKNENHNVTSIFMRGDGESMAKFAGRVAGQYGALKLFIDGAWSQPHPFTISNTPHDDYIQMTIKAVGDFTTRIQSLPAGTQAMCEGPFGKFCKDIDTEKHVTLLAGGIGITPFLSVLRTMRRGKKWPESIVLFWANNSAADFFLMKELCEIAGEKSVRMVLVQGDGAKEKLLEIPSGSSACVECGYLTKDILAKYSDLSAGKIYMCGPPPMVEFEKSELQQCNIDPARIEMEKIITPKKK